jgi:Ser-Thr-rich glycosyl-phosphatidyl-inositol-anchored membrane family
MNKKAILNYRLVLLVSLALLGSRLLAQSVEVDRIELLGDKVVVHYKLDDANPNRQYLVNLFTSNDNFASPLTRVTGDVGTEVKPGSDRKIIWDITKELGAFKGNLSFEVRIRIFVPFVKLSDFDEGKIFKRGKNYPITWTSGNLGGQINIELFNKIQERIMGENNLPNSGKYEFFIPASTASGSGYQLKFTNTKDLNDVQFSKPFTIKPKIPMLLKAGAILVVGGAVYLATSGSKAGGGVMQETPIADFPETFPPN